MDPDTSHQGGTGRGIVAKGLWAFLLCAASARGRCDIPPPSAEITEPLEEIIIQAPEPRFVAPTRRDRIGRIWAPVFINGKGPFRLVLDSGASHSGIIARVAETLGLPLNQSQPVLLRGVTGSATVPTVHVDSLTVGDLVMDATVLPIVTDALGGAEGILGTEAMAGKRIFIDFRHDWITISRSHDERADRGFIAIPFHLLRGQLVVVEARVGGIRTQAIIDTGGQVTVANLALRDALVRQRPQLWSKSDEIVGVTLDIQRGDTFPTPPIQIGALQILSAAVTFGDMRIFEYWRLTHEPAMLVGMDVLGLLDILIIDYRRHELQIRLPNGTE